ncbi:putative virion structural protein [Stenotrophomonas phage A1432]|uniref:Virion structural protein n=1 Tax=Stenotrophomonas phage A1432 TaxID=2930315 RepID=A0A9E7N4E7_9CAUD|nr:putative virion structural protein [Stenotrophomonas phage A1432]UTC27979.1 putative virion structural protein [Stenotrophomonas phage A1432]
MTYAAVENSAQGGAPVELYEFTQGLQRWFYCSGADVVNRLGIDYAPSNIQRDRIKQSTDVFKNGIKLSFPRDNEFAVQFLGFAPELPTTVSIFRGHYSDPDKQFVIYWKGRLLSAKATDSKIELECEPVYTSIRRPGLRAKFEYGCRHVLYGRRCAVNQETYKFTGTVIGVTGGLVVAVAGIAGVYPDGYFTGGVIYGADRAARFIVAHTGNNLTLSRPLTSLVGAMTVTVYPGCDHLRTTCETKFNNLDNFGGFPWVPSRNPFDGSSIA